MDHDGATTRLLVSRREVLGTATYGIGAALLLKPLLDVPAPPVVTPPSDAAAASPASAAERGGGAGADAVDRRPRAVHRAELSSAGQPRAVCRSSVGVLVVGAGEAGQPVSWLTEDGGVWVEQHLTSPAGGTPSVWGVAAHGDRAVAVGSTSERHAARVQLDPEESAARDDEVFDVTRSVPSVWWTADGAAWSGRTLEDCVHGPAQLMAVACDGARLVAVGAQLDDDAVHGLHGIVLTSDDGVAWRPAAMPGGRPVFSEGTFTAVCRCDDGWIAASSDLTGGMLWRSADAEQWVPAAGSRDALRGVTVQGVGARGGRILVAGTSLLDATPRYRASEDGGRTWRTARLDVELLAGPDARVQDLRVIAGDVVLVGTRGGVPVIEGGELDGGD